MNNFITVKSIVDENFQDYKKSSMFIALPKCDFKCFRELGLDPSGCQNFETLKLKNFKISIESVFERYIGNPITKSIVLGGLEPFCSFDEIFSLISYFRNKQCFDDFVIYSGYYPDEIQDKIEFLKQFKNIIVKFGRFVPNSNSKFDNLMGISLASENQFSMKIS